MKATFIALLAFSLCLPAPAQNKEKPLPKDIPSLKALAEKGDVKAQFRLQEMYSEGKGVKQDFSKAVKWIRKAAEQGHTRAQAGLGVAYARGSGVEQDFKEAAKWWHKSAEQGDSMGQHILGLAYSRGTGVSKDNVTAYAWWNIAATNGNANAVKNKAGIATIMTSDQIAKGEELSVELRRRIEAKAKKTSIKLRIEQLTSGTKHHFFGYIGQCQTIPWNASGRYVLGLEIDRIDRLPTPKEAATVFVIDTHQDNRILRLDRTHAWNPQQGTMFYWHSLKAETQFFFNDRDIRTGKVFTVLYDLEKRKRVREYKYDNSPIGNGGVAADGSIFLGLNYGRLARLRLVTGYPEALDWSKDEPAPRNDGIFVVDIKTGKKRLLVSYHQLDEALKRRDPKTKHSGLFINHTLLNRKSVRVYFFVRAGWSGKKDDKINMPCSIHIDGSGLTLHDQHIGGHPEWAEGNLLIGRKGNKQIFYGVDKKKVVGQLGTPKMFPKPEGDISLSPSGQWFVNGYKKSKKDAKNYYAVYRRADGAFARSEGIDKGSYSGDIRIDPAPRWNRTNDAILIPGIAKNKTRQMFVIRVVTTGESPPPKPKKDKQWKKQPP